MRVVNVEKFVDELLEGIGQELGVDLRKRSVYASAKGAEIPEVAAFRKLLERINPAVGGKKKAAPKRDLTDADVTVLEEAEALLFTCFEAMDALQYGIEHALDESAEELPSEDDGRPTVVIERLQLKPAGNSWAVGGTLAGGKEMAHVALELAGERCEVKASQLGLNLPDGWQPRQKPDPNQQDLLDEQPKPEPAQAAAGN